MKKISLLIILKIWYNKIFWYSLSRYYYAIKIYDTIIWKKIQWIQDKTKFTRNDLQQYIRNEIVWFTYDAKESVVYLHRRTQYGRNADKWKKRDVIHFVKSYSRISRFHMSLAVLYNKFLPFHRVHKYTRANVHMQRRVLLICALSTGGIRNSR